MAIQELQPQKNFSNEDILYAGDRESDMVEQGRPRNGDVNINNNYNINNIYMNSQQEPSYDYINDENIKREIEQLKNQQKIKQNQKVINKDN